MSIHAVLQCFWSLLEAWFQYLPKVPKCIISMDHKVKQKQMKCYKFLQIWSQQMMKLLIFISFYKICCIHLNALFGSLPMHPGSQIFVDYGSRSNIFRISVSCQICCLEAPPGSQVIDFLLVFNAFVRTLESSKRLLSTRRIFNVDIWFKSRVRLTIRLAQYQNH